MKPTQWSIACLFILLLAGCGGVRSGGGGGGQDGNDDVSDDDDDNGDDDDTLVGTDNLWIRAVYNDGTTRHSFVQVNRPDHCATAQSEATAASDLSAAALELAADLSAGAIDQGEYVLSLCLMFRDYYEEIDPLYGNAPFVSTSMQFGTSGDAPSEGFFLATWGIGQLPDEYDGTFSATHLELAANAHAGLAQMGCSEASSFANGAAGGYGYGYPEGFGQGYLEGSLAINSAGADAWDLTLTDVEYFLTYPGETPTGDPEPQTLSIDARFNRCDLEVDGPAP